MFDDFISYCVDNCFSNSDTKIGIKALKFAKDVNLQKSCVLFEINGKELKILGNESGVDKLRLDIFIKLLDATVSKFGLDLNFKFIVNTSDEDVNCGFPVFQFSRNTIDSHNLLVPDPHLLGRYLNKTEIEDVDFEDKKDVCIFRGSDTGKFPNSGANARIFSCLNFKDRKKYDFKISNFTQYNEDVLKINDLSISDISGDYLSNEQQLQYKYIADMDGNTIAWDRNCWALPSNSILVKYQFSNLIEYETWYSRYMYDNKIVPISKFGDDVFKIKNKKELLEKQKSFAKVFLSQNIVLRYCKEILEKYRHEYRN